MKRRQRINRVTRRRPPQRSRRLWLIAAIVGSGGLLLQAFVVAVVAGGVGISAAGYYKQTATEGLTLLRHSCSLVDVQPTRILDRKGRLLWEISDTSRGLHQNVPLSKIPAYMKEAIIATEDHTFWTNPGFDPKALGRALLLDLQHGGTDSGGSGITQQIVKRCVLNSQKTYIRKLQEVIIASAVARPGSGFSKDKILSMYLNSVFFGHEANGVEAAARVFFGKHVWQLDLAQSALLAGLVQLPTYYDPLGPYGKFPSIRRMKTVVLPRMLAEGYITTAQMRQAEAEADRFVFSEPGWSLTTSVSAAPYWTDWIKHLLTYGTATDVRNGWYTDPTLAAVVAQAGGLASGLTIQTTLDLDLYRQAQAIMNNRVAALAYRNVTDAAIVTIDPQSSECLAMVGGLDYNSPASGSQINMAASPRSPGSSFKVFTYLTAFKQGWGPATMLLDEPKSWPDPTAPGGVYSPMNYDLTWHGAVTVRMALANSYNMPAIRTIDAVGISNVLQTAEDMGAWHLRTEEKGAGLSTTLGSLPVPLWQMAQAYNVIANMGVYRPMDSILSIKDAQGVTVWSYHRPPGIQVLAPQFAYLLISIMKDNYARIPAFGSITPLRLSYPVDTPAAVKTGTSQNFKDNLTIGFTPNLLTATWVGNTDNSPMQNVEGVDGAGPIWNDVMEYDLQQRNLPLLDFTPPPGVILARVSSSGYLADARTAWPITDLFAAGALPHQYDSGYGENYLRYRVLGQSFSIDGGTTGSAVSGPTPLTSPTSPYTSTTPFSGTLPNNANVPSGFTGLLSQPPPSTANLCGGRSWTYTTVIVNGKLAYRYVCQ